MQRTIRQWAGALLGVLTVQAGWAATLPAGVSEVTKLEGVTEYRLANGLQVLLAPDESKPTATVNVTYRVGSRMESYGETGMAHLLEHLMFKGTPQHPDITGGLTRHGMRPNGTTWFDRTNYFESFPASTANLDWALHMEADRMTHSFIARKDLDSEMTVVRNEMERGENDPSGVLMDKIMAAAFQWHNYGKSTIGARSDVENVSIPHLQAFYHKYYQPDNATVVVAGRFDLQRTLKEIQATFGAIPRPKRVLEPTYTLDPSQDGERQVILRRVGDVQYIEAVYHAVAAASPDGPVFDVLAQILGDTPTGRLHKSLVETGKATSVGTDYFDLDEPGVLFLQAEVRKDQNLDGVKDAFLATVEQIKAQPITADEVDRARANLRNDIETTFNDPEKFGIALSTAIANGDWRLFFLNRDRLAKVTPADVERVAEAYLLPSNRTLGLFIPTVNPLRAPTPQRVDAEAQLKGYQGNADYQAGEAFDVSPASIQQHTQWGTLPNGMRYALLAKKTRGNSVYAQLNLHFGAAESLKGQEQVGDFVAGLLDRGAAGLSRTAIQDKFTALKAHVAFGGSATGATVMIQTVRENLPATLDLVTKILRQPEFPEGEVSQWREATLADIEESRTDPQAMASNRLHRYFNRHPRGDLRYTSTFDETAEDVKAVTRDQVVKFYQKFYGASHGELAVVGDFDGAAVTKVVTGGLGQWSSAEPYTVVLDDYQAFPGKTLQEPATDKANAVFLAWQPLPLKDNDPSAQALTLGNYILGEGFLNSRLATRIRQKEGLSYGVGSFLRLNDKVANSAFGAYAIYAPQNRQRVATAFTEVIDQVLHQGLTPAEIEAGKAALMQARQLSRAQDRSLAAQLDKLLFDQRDALFLSQQDDQLMAADTQAVNQALQKYLDPAQFVQVFVGDFSAKKP
ncbi:MAG: insulinase family protein [Ferrovum sp.]|nr:insulinase family protein [Ferrovum sp.]NDU86692.1 insulinase family protein [Ferrovum sp.]